MGKEATYQCNDGYSIEHGWRVRTCQSSREWSGYPAVCTKSKENKHIIGKLLIMVSIYGNVLSKCDAYKSKGHLKGLLRD